MVDLKCQSGVLQKTFKLDGASKKSRSKVGGGGVYAIDSGLLLHTELRGRSLGLLDTFVSFAKTAELIEMPFG